MLTAKQNENSEALSLRIFENRLSYRFALQLSCRSWNLKRRKFQVHKNLIAEFFDLV